MASTLSLLRSPRFLPIYIAQFLGVFNDNVFKSALFIIVAFELTNSPEKAGVINNLAALLLILPYFMLSTLAGQLADRGRKAFMIQNNKIAEIIISLLATLSLFFQNAGFMIFILFLLGAQSAMFGPNKFAILPQLLSRKELVTGNALITSGTFIATLLGMLIGSLLAQQNHTWIWVGGTCTTAAFIGYLSARQLPETDIGDQHLKINWNLHKQTHLLLRIARNSPRIWSSILAISWFWFLTIAFLTQMPTIIRYLAATDESAMSLVLGVFILGIGAGCGLSTYISSHKAETGIAPIVLAILSFFTISLAITTGQVGAALDQPLFHLNDFLNTSYGKTLIYKFFLIGLCLGAFGLPCYTELQEATRTRNRARIISINNVLNATFMLISSVVAIALLGILKINLQNYLLFIALFNLLFAFYLYKKTSHRVLRFLAQIASHLLYKIDKQGIEKLPLDGAAILVCNHVSYADAIVLYGSYKRPIRFLIYKSIYDHPALTWAFNGYGHSEFKKRRSALYFS